MNIAKPAPNIPPPPVGPFLIAIGYWDGDKEMCREMVDLMVDLQEKPVSGKEVKVWLVRRQDCPADKEMLAKLRTRFDAINVLSTSPLRGYPGGSNGVFGTTAIHISNSSQPFDGWLWMEPDCVPMYPNWWVDLHKEWRNRPGGIEIMGWKGDCNGDGSGWHITGCAIYNQQIARMINGIASCDRIPWDYQCRSAMLSKGKEISKIHLCWRAREAKDDIFFRHYAMVHGYKDNSLLKLVRTKYCKNS